MTREGGGKKYRFRRFLHSAMSRRTRQTDVAPDMNADTGGRDKNQATTWRDYIRFVVFVIMLLVPVYAIAKSAINHDWIMMIIDALFVPVGFVHGLLLLSGIID